MQEEGSWGNGAWRLPHTYQVGSQQPLPTHPLAVSIVDSHRSLGVGDRDPGVLGWTRVATLPMVQCRLIFCTWHLGWEAELGEQ